VFPLAHAPLTAGSASDCSGHVTPTGCVAWWLYPAAAAAAADFNVEQVAAVFIAVVRIAAVMLRF